MEITIDAFIGSPVDAIREFDTRQIPRELIGRVTTYMAEGDRFDSSPVGVEFDKQALRFSAHFGYEPGQMIRDLRLDVQPGSHNRLAYLHAANVAVQQPRIDKREAGIALLSQRIHDIGEVTDANLATLAGGSVGDIPYSEKTSEDRMVESRMRHVLYDTFFSDYPPELLERLEGVISHAEGDSEAHDIAECGHANLAYAVGLKAVKIVLKEQAIAAELPLKLRRPSEQTLRLSKLGVIVTKRMRNDLLKFADKGYVAAQNTLTATEAWYQRGQSEIELSDAA